MKIPNFQLLFVFLILGCTDKSAKETQESDNNHTAGSSIEVGCYTYTENNDTIYFQVLSSESPISGNLTYALNEKDLNTGKFEGNLKGDTLVGFYNFQSEGRESRREIAFLLRDNKLIEGYGELDENGTKFKDINTIKFSETIHLLKAPCEE